MTSIAQGQRNLRHVRKIKVEYDYIPLKVKAFSIIYTTNQLGLPATLAAILLIEYARPQL